MSNNPTLGHMSEETSAPGDDPLLSVPEDKDSLIASVIEAN